MRLAKFEIRNFMGIESLALSWDDLLVIIGANNCGKSTILTALATFLSGSSVRDTSHFRNHHTDAAHAIELVGHFDSLTDHELQQVALRGRVHNGCWILKKRYWQEIAEGEDGEKATWKEQLFSFSSIERFEGWPDVDTAWNNFPPLYADLIAQIPNRGARTSAATRDQLKAMVRERLPELVGQEAPQWIPNPGGGGNWKSNANSVLPRCIFVRAVHEATDETNSREASTYGRLINLIVEQQMMQRPEMVALNQALENVFQLFREDDENPEAQAIEVRNLQERINAGLADVIGGKALIKTDVPSASALLMPSTSLLIQDPSSGVQTDVSHQGHGLQRTLVLNLLMLLAEAHAEIGGDVRQTILLVEEPELYMHPQMERRMRDVLYRLSARDGFQVACCTHSPVFVDISKYTRSIVRLSKDAEGVLLVHQCNEDVFVGDDERRVERERLLAVSRFNPAVNELFFANRVVLLEELSAAVALERAAERTGLFERNPGLRHSVALIDCGGKKNLVGFQRILNKFELPYVVVFDWDEGNAASQADNEKIERAANDNPIATTYAVRPRDLETLLGYVPPSKEKPYTAYVKVNELVDADALPQGFRSLMNVVFLGREGD
jgi:predicted ATP-dependent endonuclease of OLD family